MSAKIDFGFALGIYGDETKANLHRLRKIRNKFAHDSDVRDFDIEFVANLCNALTIPREFDGIADAMRQRYQIATHWIGAEFIDFYFPGRNGEPPYSKLP